VIVWFADLSDQIPRREVGLMIDITHPLDVDTWPRSRFCGHRDQGHNRRTQL
jgi:hypothetical protein